MCSDCCASAVQHAINDNTERDACKTHRQNSVITRSASPPQIPAPIAPRQSQVLVQQPITSSASNRGTQTLAARPLHNTQLTQSQTRPNGRALANPLPPTWAASFRLADNEKKQIESLKAKNQRLAEQRKKTVELVVYHTVSLVHSQVSFIQII